MATLATSTVVAIRSNFMALFEHMAVGGSRRKAVDCGPPDRLHHALGKRRPRWQRDYRRRVGRRNFLTVAPVVPASSHPERRGLVKGNHTSLRPPRRPKASRPLHATSPWQVRLLREGIRVLPV